MALVKFIGNTKEKMVDNIRDICGWGENIAIAVAYLKSSGYNSIKNTLLGKNIRILVGFDFWLTDVEPLRKILKEGYLCKIYKTPMSDDEKSYHPKIYIAKRKNEVRILIGSSNLTNGGLYSNIEGNILLSGNVDEPVISDVLEFFEEKWKSSLSKNLDNYLLNEYADLKSEYEKHTKQIHSKPSFVSKKDNISSRGNSVIICMSREHDMDNMYNKLVGVPIRAKKLAFENIKKGTRLFIYYIGHGISKVAEALGKPYLDNTVINEWKDGLPETYPVRVKTKLLHHYSTSIKMGKLQELGVCRVDTGTKIVGYHLQSSVIPISDNDGDTIEDELNQ